MLKFLQQIYNFITYFIAPPYCLFCRQNIQDRVAFCSTCSMTILPIVPYDFHVGRGKDIKVYAMAAYKDPLRTLILSKRASNATPFVYLADMMSKQKILQHIDFDIIVFIPLHWTRYAARGFNQAQIIAEHLAKKQANQLFHF